MLDWRPHIATDPATVGGQPAFRGTRVTLHTILASLAEGDGIDEFLRAFPTLTRDHVRAAIAFAAASAVDELPNPQIPKVA